MSEGEGSTGTPSVDGNCGSGSSGGGGSGFPYQPSSSWSSSSLERAKIEQSEHHKLWLKHKYLTLFSKGQVYVMQQNMFLLSVVSVAAAAF